VSRFVSAVSRGEPPEVSVSDGLAAQAFIEAAYQSNETGRSVRPADLLKAEAVA
jgi:predicted dehydrogenase